MAGSGPPPNPNSRRQTGNQAHSWVDLPADGYAGPVPEWPLRAYGRDEQRVWELVWRTPQASAWARNGWSHDVALYVRFRVQAEDDIEAAREARMWSDRLGLNPTAMVKNRWRVRGDEVQVQRDAKPPAEDTRRRLKVADSAVASG